MTEADHMALEAINLLKGTSLRVADLGARFEAMQNDYIFQRELGRIVFCCIECQYWRDREDANDCGDGFRCDECAGSGWGR